MMVALDEGSSILEICRYFNRRFFSEENGKATLSKTFLATFLSQTERLKTLVHGGGGQEFWPLAYQSFLNGGSSYAVDSARIRTAFEELSQVPELESFLESVCLLKLDSMAVFDEVNPQIDLLYLDDVQGEDELGVNFRFLVSCIKEGGFLFVDQLPHPSSSERFIRAMDQFVSVFETERFVLLQKCRNSTRIAPNAGALKRKLSHLYQKLLSQDFERPRVTVGVITYNHVRYIEECLESLLCQEGHFDLEIIICDDSSTDGTSEKIELLQSSLEISDKRKLQHIRHPRNVGMVSTFFDLISRMKGSDFFSLIDGDDYYSSPHRLAKHLALHQRFPETVLSFNDFNYFYEDENRFASWSNKATSLSLQTDELIDDNLIGTLSTGFYDSRLLRYLDPTLVRGFCGEWFFNIFCSRFGVTRRLPEVLSVYRKHSKGIWSGKSELESFRNSLSSINHYNAILDFEYDLAFTKAALKRRVSVEGKAVRPVDLLILDDVFPHPLSGFRYQEFSSLLHEFPSSGVLTTGESVHILGKENIGEISANYKRKFPQFSGQLYGISPPETEKPDLLYATFLANARYYLLPRSEITNTPFAFTLYPGGTFGLFNRQSDELLSTVLSSPNFRKVIVTQSVTYDYLISKNFCSPEQVEFIFGVVVPLEKLWLNLEAKRHFGTEKNTLDICFVAHKYTPYGEDKGYGTFLQVARRLSGLSKNIRFHIVGPFDESVLDIAGIQNLCFYGSRPQDWFDEFYLDKDILLSPNRPSCIYQGNFDGFPTGCATDASLREVAMFCTDPLNLNQGIFCDGEEIVIIEDDCDAIGEAIEYYFKNPEKLRMIAKAGCRRSRELYSYERQIAPRIALLRNLIEPDQSIPSQAIG